METKFKTSLQFSFRLINHAVVLESFGHYVEIVRQPGSRRTVFYADDLPAVHDLLEKYDRGDVLGCSTRDILAVRTDIVQRAKRIAAGEVL